MIDLGEGLSGGGVLYKLECARNWFSWSIWVRDLAGLLFSSNSAYHAFGVRGGVVSSIIHFSPIYLNLSLSLYVYSSFSLSLIHHY